MKRSGFKKKSYAEALKARSQKPNLARRTKLKGGGRQSKGSKLSTAKLKKKLDAIFSQYIRQKYSKEGHGRCYTCGAYRPINQLQCGHFVSRGYLATRFDEDNVRPQCVGCNVFGGGKTAQFAINLQRDCGTEIVTRLYKKAQEITKDFPYEEKIKEYELKLSTLASLTRDK